MDLADPATSLAWRSPIAFIIGFAPAGGRAPKIYCAAFPGSCPRVPDGPNAKLEQVRRQQAVSGDMGTAFPAGSRSTEDIEVGVVEDDLKAGAPGQPWSWVRFMGRPV